MTEQQFEAILRQALRPEVDPRDTAVPYKPTGKGYSMNMKSILRKCLIAAAAVMMLTTTVYATELFNITSLVSRGGFHYKTDSYQDMDKVMQKAGFEISVKERFENGYSFNLAEVRETAAVDENGEERFTYRDIGVNYTSADGNRVKLVACQANPNISEDDRAPDGSKMVGDIQLLYQLDQYRFVPADYELTPEDEAWMAEPGHFLSYGSDEVEETQVAFVLWQQDGIEYFFMDTSGMETAENLFAMAEELITQ